MRRMPKTCNTITSFLVVLLAIYVISASTMMMKWRYHRQILSLMTSSHNRDENIIGGDGDGGHRQNRVTVSHRRSVIDPTVVSPKQQQQQQQRHSSDNNRLTKQDIMDRHRTLPQSEPRATSYLNSTDVQYLKSQLLNNSIVYWPGPYDGAAIVVEEYKLVFFTQGKVACTVFKQLLRRMMHLSDWDIHKEPNIPHNPKYNSLTYLYHYNPDDALTIMTSPSWTRAIFVRDPKERTLSAFLDKAVKKNGSYIQKHCCPNNDMGDGSGDDDGSNTPCYEKASQSFLGFLQVIQQSCCCDPHWRKQSERITPAFRPFINFVGRFENIQSDTKRLLDHLDGRQLMKTTIAATTTTKSESLWEMFGSDGWGPDRNMSIFADGTKAKHETSAITKLKQFYNATSERLVDELYHDDYHDELLNFDLLKIA